MNVRTANWIYVDSDGKPIAQAGVRGYPMLQLELDEGDAIVGPEQKFIRYGVPAVFLGDEWHDRTRVDFKGDPDRDLDPILLEGFTDEPTVVELAREFVAAVDAGTFYPKAVVFTLAIA